MMGSRIDGGPFLIPAASGTVARMGMIASVFGLGSVVLIMGLLLIVTGSGSPFAYVLAGVGGVATQVGIIALGVRLGNDA